MPHELDFPSNGDCFGSSIASEPFVTPDRQSATPYLNKDGDLPYWYSIFSPMEGTPSLVTTPLAASGSILIPPRSSSFVEPEVAAADYGNRLYLARLTLQYQEVAERYDLCLSDLRDCTEEIESLRRENASIRIANVELARRLGLIAGKHAGRVPSSASAALEDEFRFLNVAELPPPSPEESPTSVLSVQESGGGHPFAGPPVVEKQVSLPKSISIRSSGYLKLNQDGKSSSAAKRNGRFGVSNPAMVSKQRVYVGGDSNRKKGARRGREDGEEEREGGDGGGALELEVYHQGMFKTELCNKWEESGECPYGDHCQFAHGITELRPVLRHPRYKTEPCRMILSGGACPYGHRCHFRHSLSLADHQRLLIRP
ncbi:zinc finger CCCH domain-containing protein 9-like [Musa acuminata AAA Group]|uniref:zinc finger CCCH domain-containing protein 9-like n=1 Tax=Musa acuminata AAA Group TaxID=214697 RepID=UPI0031E005B4